ncbi:MAG: hypothetical protein LBL98_08175 [Ruminococcus sp.]|jgi:hypothetical protein|nr:hypothetical protein [Ruminococcus sp.]
MAQIIAGGFDFSPYIIDNGYKIRRVNIYEDLPADFGKVISGYRIEIEINLKNINETDIAAINASLEDEQTDVTYTFCGEERTDPFPRPEVEVIAVSENPDGIYWDVFLRFLSEGFYSDDRL